MTKRRQVLKGVTDKNIRRLDISLRILILVMTLIVIYDAFRYAIPMYYILFLFLGVFTGRGYRQIFSVRLDKTSRQLALQSRKINVFITLFLISIRYFFGKMALTYFSIEYTSDALYLFFIGLYWSKWNAVVYHVERKVFELIKKNLVNP